MKSLAVWFNLILICGVMAATFTSCASNKPAAKEKDKKEKEDKPEKYASDLRIFLEVGSDGTEHNAPVPIYRAHPTYVNVQNEAVLDTGYLKKAEVVDNDQMGSYAIKLIFNDRGAFRLQNLTTANKGHRLAVFCQWKDARWLAAPMIDRGLTDGVLIFTPDATREESDRIVRGLNNVIKKLDQPYTF